MVSDYDFGHEPSTPHSSDRPIWAHTHQFAVKRDRSLQYSLLLLHA